MPKDISLILFSVVAGFILALLMVNSYNIKQWFKKKIADRRYNKLANGIPKRVVGIRDFHNVWWNKDYPFYIEGKVYSLDRLSFYTYRCNDSTIRLVDEFGDKFILEARILSSKQLGKNKWWHNWGCYLKTNHDNQTTFKGRFVNIDSIREVY